MLATTDLELRERGGLLASLQALARRNFPKLATAIEVLTERWRGSARLEPLARAIERQDLGAAATIATSGIIGTAPDELTRIQRALFGGRTGQEEAFAEAGVLTRRRAAKLPAHIQGLEPGLRTAATAWLARQDLPLLANASAETRAVTYA